jgi:mRNA-degrading endonuclease RelE of RelBE toxin-antitoxin system
MKPKEMKPEVIYRIIDRNTGEAVGSYSRAFCDEYDFFSIDEARHANCHGIFEDKKKYKIAKYRVTYTLLDDDCDE